MQEGHKVRRTRTVPITDLSYSLCTRHANEINGIAVNRGLRASVAFTLAQQENEREKES